MRTFLRFGQVVAGSCAIAAAVAACTRSQAAGGGRVPVTVARAERRAVPYTIGALGTVEPISTVAVTSQVNGMLQRVRFHEGDEVSAGQVLFEIDPRPYRAALTAAQAALARDLVLPAPPDGPAVLRVPAPGAGPWRLRIAPYFQDYVACAAGQDFLLPLQAPALLDLTLQIERQGVISAPRELRDFPVTGTVALPAGYLQ